MTRWVSTTFGLVTIALASAVVAVNPAVATAELDHYFTTVSGAVRCIVNDAEVVCERRSLEGFLQAPLGALGTGHWNLANLKANGAFTWAEGNIGGAYPERDMLLIYGSADTYSGWTVAASSSGTRFTNNRSGHGMFVSVDNTYAF